MEGTFFAVIGKVVITGSYGKILCQSRYSCKSENTLYGFFRTVFLGCSPRLEAVCKEKLTLGKFLDRRKIKFDQLHFNVRNKLAAYTAFVYFQLQPIVFTIGSAVLIDTSVVLVFYERFKSVHIPASRHISHIFQFL